MFTREEWYTHFMQNKKGYIKVEIEDSALEVIKRFSNSMEKKSSKEFVYMMDGKNIGSRWTTGMLGEYAVHKKFCEWGIIKEMPALEWKKGDSDLFDVPDFIDCGVVLGCKTSRIEQSIKFKESPRCSEIVCVYVENEQAVYICGIAPKSIQTKYGRLDYIKNPEIRAKAGTKGGKLGFINFEKLTPFTKENVLQYKASLRVIERGNANDLQQVAGNARDCFYMEKIDARGEIAICHSYKGTFNTIFVPYPFTDEGVKQVKAFFKKEGFVKGSKMVVGYQLMFILNQLQEHWGYGATELTLNALDLWNILYSTEVKPLIQSKSFDALLLYLRKAYKLPKPPIFRTNPTVNMDNIFTVLNFYNVLATLCSQGLFSDLQKCG